MLSARALINRWLIVLIEIEEILRTIFGRNDTAGQKHGTHIPMIVHK